MLADLLRIKLLPKKREAPLTSRLPICGILFFLCMGGCGLENNPELIIDRSVKAHGGDLFNHTEITFDFRNRRYTRYYYYGKFRYSRGYTDSSGNKIFEAVNNDSTWQTINGKHINLSDSIRTNIFESINSVVYFGFLPFKLQDPAVNVRYIGNTTIREEPYHKIEVTFDKEGGGIDHQDCFVYWISKNNYQMDYFGYRYEVDGGGERFREAYNQRNIKGIRIQDYRNYRVKSDTLLPQRKIERFDVLLKRNKLEEVSLIKLENVKIEVL